MTFWIKRIHMYTGLLNSVALLLFGVIGIAVTILPRPRERTPPEAQVEVFDLEIPGDLDDRELADYIQAELAIPLTGPAPKWSFGRNDDGDFFFRLPTPARRYEVTALEAENQLRVRTQPFDTWQYLFHLHEMSPAHPKPDWRIQSWAWYIEFSIWSLIAMTLTGIYLWLVTRPGYRWAQISLAGGKAVFVLFYMAIR